MALLALCQYINIEGKVSADPIPILIHTLMSLQSTVCQMLFTSPYSPSRLSLCEQAVSIVVSNNDDVVLGVSTY